MKGVLVALTLWCVLVGSTVLAEEPSIPKCGPVADMAARLESGWGEVPLVSGQVGPQLFIWFASPVTGTWTATVTDVTGQMCVLTSGDNSRMVPNA